MEGRSTEKGTQEDHEFVLREFGEFETDFNYVTKTWLRDFKRSPWAGLVANNVYHRVYGESLRQLFNRGMQVKILCVKGLPQVVIGFIAYETKPTEQVLHYIYLISKARGKGLAKKMLLECQFNIDEPIVHTFRTFDFIDNFAGRHRPEIARRKDA